MRRTDAGFVPIGWDEALDLAAERLIEVRNKGGNDSIALYRGNPTVHDAQSLLYWNVLQRAIPTKSQFSAGSLDTWPRWVQAGLMYGGFLHTPVPDLARCEYLLILGANPVVSNGSLMTAPGIKKRLRELRGRGGRLVVVDPRRSETAEIADLHVPIRPGGDAAYGRMGASVQRFGTLAHWAIDLLNIVTGNLDREGGVLFPKPAVSLAFVGPKPGESVLFGRYQSPVSGYDEILGE